MLLPSMMARGAALARAPACRGLSALMHTAARSEPRAIRSLCGEKGLKSALAPGSGIVRLLATKQAALRQPLVVGQRHLQTAVVEAVPEGTRRIMGWWMMGCAGMVVGAVVIGGITRLTESGLSMTSWHPLRVRPPMTHEEWVEEFERYKTFPEYKYVHRNISLEEFKAIFFWEFTHRVWGRMIGVAFAVPGIYWLTRKHIPGPLKRNIFALACGIGFQGVIGWWMVKSGLVEDPDPNAVPRVSQYRLATHLGAAFLLYVGMLWTGMSLMLKPQQITDSRAARLLRYSKYTAGLVFITALSGAFVAGLDAGLVYNTFPKFADRWVPDDLMALNPPIRNMTENTTTVQFNHRVLGTTTAFAVAMLWGLARPVHLPPRARLAVNALLAMASAQFALGIATLLYFVPVPLAATHQAGSVSLLTISLWFVYELRAAAAKAKLRPRVV